MSGNPSDWNIVILGAWNTAILTPAGIARRLLQLPPETPLEVQVPINELGPIKVRYEGIIIEPSSSRLVIQPAQSTEESLGKAVEIAQRALNGLPETPFSAGGLNIRFLFESAPDSLIDAGTSSIDDILSDNGLTTVEKKFNRMIRWEQGVLNLDVQEREDSSALVVFNFHYQSTSSDELSDWFSKFKEMIRQSNDLISLIAKGD